ncbi:Catabolite control protein [uncultured Butyricicoccus sp.]|uniref:LacI family DNA-binding transcriptional regulator n=1 Tax=Agathobaculum ammoniilyticum TaxID=2981778 RepID=A0ABT2U0P7_9FIRM|nr:LacI family DNA-binding transcriptional regulator [Agathobaculum ammoniilyticum]MBS6882771.1 LacI family DNA-binding transcriptional regulator [Clostridiaceae bacterium]MCU6787527.1 LacI family DNA-binding transcriptional regulator [Agathobaculum ammoniilyticum]SCI37890.1 Catabolite control protein [uncultured Butyricicoccus sp.]
MTIAEIAQRAGVSKAAVSRYLNNGYISSEKREAIRRVIEETGYIPSQQAQTLRTGKSRMIGVIVPRIDSEAVSRVVAGISRIFEEQGYRLLLANTENRMDKELEYLEVFRTGNVDGVLLVATILSPAHRKAVQACSVPVVLLGQQMDGVTCVYHDDRGAAYAVTRLMLQGGRKKLGYIGVTQRDRAAGASRRAGFLDALHEAGLEETASRMEQSDFSIDGGYAAAERMLQRAIDVDGIFCATDSIAIGAMNRLEQYGRRVPEDVALAGIGHSRLGELIRPRLTTAHYYYQTSGEEAAKDLIEMIEQGMDRKKQLKLGFEIRLGETT